MNYNDRIKVTNTSIIVHPYKLGESIKLEEAFRIYDPIKHTFFLKGLYYDEKSETLYLPSGMDLWYVKRALNEKYYTYVEHNKYYTIDNIMMKYKPRDNNQQEALKFAIGIGKYEENADKSQLLISLNTGKGKTYCSVALMSYFKIRSMVITSSNSLLDQWEQNILEYTNLDKSDIVRISGSDYCNMILSGNSAKANNGKIFLCSHGTLRSFGERYGWNKITELFEYLGIGLKFYDEAHTSYDNMLMIDFFTNTFKTFYVTATPGRSNYQENHIFQISLKNVPMIDLFDENNDPHTSYIAIKWNSKPTAQQISACAHRFYKFDRNKYIDYVTKKPEFYQMMRIIMDMVIKCKGRVLMYIGTNEGILRLYKWLGENYPEFIGDIGVFTSLVSKEDKRAEKKKKLLLSTTKSAGLGEHIDGLKMTILLAEPFKSDILARQTLGRTRDDNTLYIELVDLGFQYCKKFYYIKLPIFNKYAKDVSDSNIDSYELGRRATILENERYKGYVRCPIRLADSRFDLDKVFPIKQPEPKGIARNPLIFYHQDNNSTGNFYK